jgi:hypothetical protein
MEEAKQWWLGDWWNAGVAWGEGKQACEETGLAYQTACNVGSVAAKMQFSRRRENLTFSHHVEVCTIDDPDVQDRFLLWCEEPLETTGKPRSTRELREAVRQYLDEQGWTSSARSGGGADYCADADDHADAGHLIGERPQGHESWADPSSWWELSP